jgi:hypothetical protein
VPVGRADHHIRASPVSLVEHSQRQQVVAAHVLACRLGGALECALELDAERRNKLAPVELAKGTSNPLDVCGEQR